MMESFHWLLMLALLVFAAALPMIVLAFVLGAAL